MKEEDKVNEVEDEEKRREKLTLMSHGSWLVSDVSCLVGVLLMLCV